MQNQDNQLPLLVRLSSFYKIQKWLGKRNNWIGESELLILLKGTILLFSDENFNYEE